MTKRATFGLSALVGSVLLVTYLLTVGLPFLLRALLLVVVVSVVVGVLTRDR